MGALAPMQQEPAAIDGTIPLERASGIGSTTIACLAHFLRFLQEMRQRAVTPQTLAQWCDFMADLVSQGLAEGSPSQAEQRAHVLQHTIDGLRPTAGGAPADALFDGPAFFSLFDQHIEEPSQTLGGGGGITVAPLATWAGTPARLICILGLSNGSFPRRDHRPGWHPLATNEEQPRQLGDPSGRDDDRHAMLLSLLACREQLVLTYQSASERDPRQLPPAPPVSDLLNALAKAQEKKEKDSSQQNDTMHYQHSLHGFSPSALGLSDRERSWLPNDYQRGQVLAQREYSNAAAEKAPIANAKASVTGAWALAPLSVEFPSGQAIKLQSVFQVFFNPCRLFARQAQLAPDFHRANAA